LTLSSEEISKLVEAMEEDTTQIRQEALKMCWYMRGGITYDQSLQLSIAEREIRGSSIGRPDD
jgi:DNA polymerase III delta subunit